MDVWLSLLFSLVLTSLMSFTIPIVLCFLLLGSLHLIAHLEVATMWANIAYENTWRFFAVFGAGSAGMGILIIALVGAIAGLIFESLNFYRYQILIDQNLSSSRCQTERLTELILKFIYRLHHR
jgi:hypothetical protein